MKEIEKLSDDELIQRYIENCSFASYVISEAWPDWQKHIDKANKELEPINEELKKRGLEKIAEDDYSEHREMVRRVERSSDDELIKNYIDINLEKDTEAVKTYNSEWSRNMRKFNDELYIIEDELMIRSKKFDAVVALQIHKGRITQDRVDELKKMSTEKLELELEDGMQIMMDYYGNGFYLQKYEDDESFMKAGDGISAENCIISAILESRGICKDFKSSEVTEIPLIAENAKEVPSVTITNNV